MKKQMKKKLTLAKETMRALENREDLRQAAGGTDPNPGFRKTVNTGCDFCKTGSCPTIPCPA